ncbi:MAG: IS110 family transposase [Verrucomicrobia bacterium]|nr:IS110 family transposase [Verrucomicrobiota bacterium]MBS0637647.1 IS110 family transposase [Verrucomicrobiota bacterium]
MQHFTGLDVSMKETSICIVDEKGKVVFETCVETQPLAIYQALKGTLLPIEKIGVESGSLSHWLVTELLELKLPVLCVDSRQMGVLLSLKINKTDKNDAKVIANAMRTANYHEVKLKSQQAVEISTLLTARATLVQQRTALKNTVRGMIKLFGIRIKSRGNKSFVEATRTAIKELGVSVKEAVETLLLMFEVLETQIIPLEKSLIRIAKADEDVLLLMSIPGVGVLTALSYKIALGDPSRFDKSSKVGAYLGMTPRQYSSGEIEIQGRISKCGSKSTRALLVGAANILLTRSKKWSKLKTWGLKLMRKKGKAKAEVAVGRKLSVIMHRMLITREPFRATTEECKQVDTQKAA